MTEQEAEVLAATLTKRLERVWGMNVGELAWTYDTTGEQWGLGGYLILQGQVVEGVVFNHCIDGDSESFRIWSEQSNTMLVCVGGNFDVGQLRIGYNAIPLSPQFAEGWMPFFRRGCWLSGAPVEASAHEKLEWIQGFSREELQAWNLKV